MKNIVQNFDTVTPSQQSLDIAVAKDSATNTVATEVERGCTIKNLFCSFDVCGTGTSGTIQKTILYLIKNVGNNLSHPAPIAVGTSNEKRFVIKMWQFMTMRNQDGNPPFHWEGWIKLPRVYHRMATDDKWQLVWANDTTTGHLTTMFIYKWYK